ncbi:MAG: orotate phosphoribosyltransferase [Candidatus Micrarchaeota archaeon]|nr:orotate phosphoribosyltransferase [Candidatus Micrarchaeota archaeon]MDE1859428.1 orotate phosphoribosyltransferase [Candidatus Micrarchaeota archaeon]
MLKDRLVELNAIKFGKFTLTSGKESDYYVDIKIAATDPRFLDEVSTELSRKVNAKVIAGVELGAVPLIVATALKSGLPYVIIRKEEHLHGTKSPMIGNVKHGEKVDVIEDVVTTGNSVLRAVKMLRDMGAIVNRAVCVVDREEGGAQLLRQNGIELIPLVRISEVKGK